MGQTEAIPTGATEPPAFTLALGHVPASTPGPSAGPVLRGPDASAVLEIGPEVVLPALELETTDPVVSLSVFLGREDDDLFASLHKEYAWKLTFKSMTLGLGIYRNIPITRTLGLQPYLGVIRSSATLRPSDLRGGRGSFEYRLTVLCVGLPLVLRFN